MTALRSRRTPCFPRATVTGLNIPRRLDTQAKSMRLKIMVEGVETEAQRIFLAPHGCAAYPGFLISQPLPPDQFRELLRKSR